MMKEEISLREIIEIVMKQKWIIVIVSISCMILSGLFSFFVLKPTYETYSIVRMQGVPDGENKTATDIKNFSESLITASTITQIIDKNQLDRNTYSVNSISKMSKLEVVPDSNTMKISIRGDDPRQVSQIANMLAFELGVSIEVSDRTNVMVESQKKLDQMADQIVVAKAKLSEAQNQLKKVPEKQSTEEALTKNDFLRSIIQDKTKVDTGNTGNLTMKSETINPAYTDLQTKVAEATIDLNMLLKEEQNYKSKLEINTSRINQIEQKATNDRLDANKSIRILDGTNSIFINPSLQPDKPVGPKVVLNIIFAALVGGMLILLFVFLRHYMRETGRSGIDE